MQRQLYEYNQILKLCSSRYHQLNCKISVFHYNHCVRNSWCTAAAATPIKEKKSAFSWLSVACVLRNKSNYYSSSLLVARTDISSMSVRHYSQINAYDILGRMLSYYSVKSHKENGFYWQRQTVKCSNIKKSTVSFKNPRKTIHIKNQTNGPYQFKNVLKRAQNQVHDSWSN